MLGLTIAGELLFNGLLGGFNSYNIFNIPFDTNSGKVIYESTRKMGWTIQAGNWSGTFASGIYGRKETGFDFKQIKAIAGQSVEENSPVEPGGAQQVRKIHL